MEAIYIISTIKKSLKNIYKIGKYSGNKKSLLSRYRTYLMDPIIFFYQRVSNANKLENELKTLLNDYRLKHSDGGRAEWISMP